MIQTLSIPGTECLAEASSNGLPISVYWLSLNFQSPGVLNPWVAPAIRGLILEPLRDSLCQLSEAERTLRRSETLDRSNKRYCQGCARNAECHYGRVFEPDLLMINGKVERGMREGLRGLSIAAGFPSKSDAVEGDGVIVRLLALGDVAAGLIFPVIEALQVCGTARGLGPDKVRFQIDFSGTYQDRWLLDPATLPGVPSLASVPWTELIVETPVFLKRQTKGRKKGRSFPKDEAPPSFSRLFSEALRTTTRALREYAGVRWLQSVDYHGLLRAAATVETGHENWHRFSQTRTSARQLARWKSSGWHGGAVYRNVPLALIPWLVWGGRIGVGDSRNCGGGLWHLRLA